MLSYKKTKNKSVRISLRIAGALFFIIGGMQFVVSLNDVLNKGKMGQLFITLLALMAVLVGIKFIRETFLEQAYDMEYHFTEKGIVVSSKKGERTIPYLLVKEVEHTVVDENIGYELVKIATEKETIGLHFYQDSKRAQEIYQYVEKQKTI